MDGLRRDPVTKADKTRKTSKDPVKLKERIAELEQEKEQVTSRIAVTKGKVASKVEDKSQLGELLELAMSLRKEQEAEMELQQQLHDQYDRKEQADHKYQRTAVRLREIRASISAGSSTALLTQLAEEARSTSTPPLISVISVYSLDAYTSRNRHINR